MRQSAISDFTLWVNPGGSDDNSGTESQPFATPQKAWEAIMQMDLCGYQPTINLSGSYSSGLVATGVPVGAVKSVNVRGVGGVATLAGVINPLVANYGARLNISGLDLQPAQGGDAVVSFNRGEITVSGWITIGACSHHFDARYDGNIIFADPINMSIGLYGNAQTLFYVEKGSRIIGSVSISFYNGNLTYTYLGSASGFSLIEVTIPALGGNATGTDGTLTTGLFQRAA